MPKWNPWSRSYRQNHNRTKPDIASCNITDLDILKRVLPPCLYYTYSDMAPRWTRYRPSAAVNTRLRLARWNDTERCGTECSGRQGHYGGSSTPGRWRVCVSATHATGGAVSSRWLTGHAVNNSQPLTGLANQLQDGDVQALADSINQSWTWVQFSKSNPIQSMTDRRHIK